MTLLEIDRKENISMDSVESGSDGPNLGSYRNGNDLGNVSPLHEITNGLIITSWVKLGCFVLIIISGVTLNSVVLAAYKQTLKKSTYMFAVSLAICDMLNCLGYIADIVILLVNFEDENDELFCFLRTYFTHFGTLLSAGLVMCIAIDRYLRVRHPHALLTPKFCLALIFGVIIANAFVTSPFMIITASKMIPRRLACLDFVWSSSMNDAYGGTEDLFNAGKLFLRTFYGISLVYLVLLFLAIVFLYTKLSILIRCRTRNRVGKLCLNMEGSDASSWADDISISDRGTPNPPKQKWREFRKDQVGFTRDLTTFVRNDSFKKKVVLHCEIGLSGNDDMTSTPKSSVVREMVAMKLKRDENSNKRRSLTPSLISISRGQSYARTFVMLTLTIVLFFFYFPCLILHVVSVNYSHVLLEYPTTSQILEHSQVVCFLINPVVFAYLNRGFGVKLKRNCCCRD